MFKENVLIGALWWTGHVVLHNLCTGVSHISKHFRHCGKQGQKYKIYLTILLLFSLDQDPSRKGVQDVIRSQVIE